MTASQALRHERRLAAARLRRERRIETAKAAALIALVLVLYAIVGTMEFYDEQTQLAFWEEQGVTIGRW